VAVSVTAVSTLVPLSFTVPTMLVSDHSSSSFPVTVVVLFAVVVRLNPVRALIGRPGPIPVVPAVVALLGILVAFDPHIVVLGKVIAFDPQVAGARARRHVRHTGRWRLTDADAERELGMRAWDRAKDHDKDGQRLQEMRPHAQAFSNHDAVKKTPTRACASTIDRFRGVSLQKT
jgi:hypothetical protein